jgi:hypothetical protein
MRSVQLTSLAKKYPSSLPTVSHEVNNFLIFMQPQITLQMSRDPLTGPHSEPIEFSRQPNAIFLYNPLDRSTPSSTKISIFFEFPTKNL